MTLALVASREGGRSADARRDCARSPWSDLTGAGDSYKTNELVDSVVVSYDGFLSRVARLYAHGHDLKGPQLSPIYGNFDGLPPAI